MGLYQAWFPCVRFPGAGKPANQNYFFHCLWHIVKILSEPDYTPPAARLLSPHGDRVSPLQRTPLRALAVALAELCLSVALSVHLPRAPAGPEILVQHYGALGLDDLAAHPVSSQVSLRDAGVGRSPDGRPGLLREVPHLLGGPLAKGTQNLSNHCSNRTYENG
jgi:hypothetical protein